MKMPAILAGLYRSLHGNQHETKELIDLLKNATLISLISPDNIARSIVSNHDERQELMKKIEMIQRALKQQENGILEEVEGVTELP
jgi:hypothetical protein